LRGEIVIAGKGKGRGSALSGGIRGAGTVHPLFRQGATPSRYAGDGQNQNNIPA
jgi:hypothetical protein